MSSSSSSSTSLSTTFAKHMLNVHAATVTSNKCEPTTSICSIGGKRKQQTTIDSFNNISPNYKCDQSKRRKPFAISGDRSPLWTTLTHAQTITEFIES